MPPPLPTVSAQGLGIVPADLLNTYVQTVTNFVQLRTFVGLNNMTVLVEGAATPGDGYQGEFYFNISSTAADDNNDVIAPNGLSTGRWIRLPFGAIGPTGATGPAGPTGATGSSSSLTVTDSVPHTVTGATQITFTDATVGGATPNATVLTGAIQLEGGASASPESGLPAAASDMGSGDSVTGLQGGENVNFSQSQVIGRSLSNFIRNAVLFQNLTPISLVGYEYCTIYNGSVIDALQQLDLGPVSSYGGTGAMYTFVVIVGGSNGIQVNANGTDNIVWNGTGGAPGGNMASSTAGSTLTIVAVGSGSSWWVLSSEGTWTLT